MIVYAVVLIVGLVVIIELERLELERQIRILRRELLRNPYNEWNGEWK